MPSTVVHVAFALLVAAALLGSAYDRRAVLVVAASVVVVDLDVFTSLVVEGSHRAMFHSLLAPLAVATYLYADTHWREESRLRARYGDYWIRVAWVSLAAVVVSGIGLDLFTAAGVNPLYPLYDQFYSFDGKAVWSAADRFVQTFVEVERERGSSGSGSAAVDVGQKGTTREYHVGSGVDPLRGPEPPGVERVFPVVYAGWQALLVLTGLLVTGLRLSGGDRATASVTSEAGEETTDD